MLFIFSGGNGPRKFSLFGFHFVSCKLPLNLIRQEIVGGKVSNLISGVLLPLHQKNIFKHLFGC